MAPKRKTKGSNRRATRLAMATTGRSPAVKTLKLPARVTKKSRRNGAERKLAEAALKKSKELLEKRVRERTRELRLANKELENEIKRRKALRAKSSRSQIANSSASGRNCTMGFANTLRRLHSWRARSRCG